MTMTTLTWLVTPGGCTLGAALDVALGSRMCTRPLRLAAILYLHRVYRRELFSRPSKKRAKAAVGKVFLAALASAAACGAFYGADVLIAKATATRAALAPTQV